MCDWFISEEQRDHEDYKEPVKTQGHEEIDIGKTKKNSNENYCYTVQLCGPNKLSILSRWICT